MEHLVFEAGLNNPNGMVKRLNRNIDFKIYKLQDVGAKRYE